MGRFPLGGVFLEAPKADRISFFPAGGICSFFVQNAKEVRFGTGFLVKKGFMAWPIVLFAKRAPSRVIVHFSGGALRLAAPNFSGVF